MMSPPRALAIALSLAVPSAVGCGRREPTRGVTRDAGSAGDTGAGAGSAGARAAVVPTSPWPPPQLAGVTAIKPRWIVRLPDRKPRIGLERVVGPVLVEGVVIVSARDAGLVALEAGTGAVRWQRRAALEVEGAVAIAATLAVVGRCPIGDAATDTPAPALAAPVLGCLEILAAADGAQRLQADIIASAGLAFAGDFAGAPGRVLGVVSVRSGARSARELLWARGGDLLAIDVATGVVRRAAHGEPHRDGELPPPPSAPEAWLLDLDRASAPVRLSLAERGPIAQVRDGELTLWQGDQVRHRVAGNFAIGDGSVWVRYHADACAFDQIGGIAPVCVDVATFEEQRGAPVAAVQVLAAAGTASGGVIAVVRLDATLAHDAVVAWSAAGELRWAWPLPLPAAPRSDEIGLAVDRDGAYVFYDAHTVARLPLP